MDSCSTLPHQVLAQYDLGEIDAVKPKEGGGIDQSFVVTAAGERYFVKRRAPDYTAEMVSCDHALVKYLARHAFPTPPVVPTYRGGTWVEWEGRIYEAYLYVTGSDYTLGDVYQMTSLGQTLAWYHRLASQYRPSRLKLPPWKHTSGVRFLKISEYVTPRIRTLLAQGRISEQEEQFVRSTTGQLEEQANQVCEEAALISLTIHGALEPGNVLFNEQGEVVAWVDWADSGQFVRVFDVAYALLKFAGRRPDAILPGQVGPSLLWPGVESFATAYRREIRLTETETALLPWLMLTIRIVDALWLDESKPIDHRRELGLARELSTWLTQNAIALQEVFR